MGSTPKDSAMNRYVYSRQMSNIYLDDKWNIVHTGRRPKEWVYCGLVWLGDARVNKWDTQPGKDKKDKVTS